MLKEDKKTRSAPYYEPLWQELTDCFTSTNAPAPGATYSSTTGELHTDDSNTNNGNTSPGWSGQAAEDEYHLKNQEVLVTQIVSILQRVRCLFFNWPKILHIYIFLQPV